MAVLGRVLISSQERIDLPDLLAIDGFTSADFKAVISSFTGNKTFIVKGLDVVNPSSSINSTSLSINIAECLVFSPDSPSGPFFQGLPLGHVLAEPVVPNLVANSTNYVYVVLSTMTNASDQRAFWDPDSTDEWGSEVVQEVDTQTVLTISVGVSTSSFPEGTIPICKVQMSNVITSITDCRNLLFRLATGGLNPDILNTKVTSPENPISITTSGGLNPFEGGDKDISSWKEFIDIVMSRLKEISGDIFWYDTTSPISVRNVWWHSLATTLKSRGEWIHDYTVPGKLSWTSDISIISLIDKRNIVLRKGEIILANEQVAFIELKKDIPANNTQIQVEFTSGTNFINSFADTAFENIEIGDWVKSIVDSEDKYMRVEGFYLEHNLGGGLTDKLLARSLKLSSIYVGQSASNFAVYSKGEYLQSDIVVTNRSVEALSAMGDKFFWIATRDDNRNSISNISTFRIECSNLVESSGKLLCTSVSHNLVDGDWITVSSGSYTGTYQVEVESADIFSIEASKLDSSFSAFYALVTTGPIFSTGGFQLEDEFHRFASSSQIIIDTVGLNPTPRSINVREDNLVQTHVPSDLVLVDGIIFQSRITVKRDFGAIKIVQGSATEVETETDLESIMSFVGMKNINEKNPTYHTPSSYNTLIGRQSFNASDSDNLTERISKITSMMADRVQERTMSIIGRSVFRNEQNGTDQVLYISHPLELNLPSSPIQAISAGAISLEQYSVGYISVNRNASSSQLLSVESISTFSVDENKILLFYRLDSSTIYNWTGQSILSGSSLIADSYEDSGSKNIFMVNSGKTQFDIGTGLITLERFESEEVSKVVTVGSSEIPPNCYFSFYEANDLVGYYVWPNVEGISTNPMVPGMIGVEVYLLSADNANTVAAKITAAIQGINRFDVTRYNNEVIIRNREFGPATDIFDGFTPTPFDLYVVQQGSRFNIDLIVSGSEVKNTIDATSLNDTGLLIIRNGYSAWVFVSRHEDKIFNNISTNVADVDSGTVYITKTSEVPVGQDVFVIWSNVNERIVQVHIASYVEDNIYEEHIVPTEHLSANTIIELPKDSLDNDQVQFYLVGAAMLQVYLNGNRIIRGVHWDEVGEVGFLGTSIKLLIDLETYDRISFRIDSKGAVYFTAPSEFQTDPFLRPSLNSAYNTGNVISVIEGRPVSLYGLEDQTQLSVGGNIEAKIVKNSANQLLNNTSSKLSGFGSEVVLGKMILKDAFVTKDLKDLISNPLQEDSDILVQDGGVPSKLSKGPNDTFLTVAGGSLSWTNVKWSQHIDFQNSSLFDLESRHHADLFESGLRTHQEIDSHLASTVGHGIESAFVGVTEAQTLKNKTVEGVSVVGGSPKLTKHIWSDSDYVHFAGSTKGFKFNGTKGIVIPSGTDSDRHDFPDLGTIRYNTQYSLLEIFNGQEWELQRAASIVELPSITSPANQSTTIVLEPIIESSPFYNIYGRPHTSSDWQIASDINFQTIVLESLVDTVNLVSFTATGLNTNDIFYVRVRYRDNVGNISYWSLPVSFIIATEYVNRPSIVSPVFGALVDAPIDIDSSVFSTEGIDTHELSQFQISVDSLFLNIIYDSGTIAATTHFQVPRLEVTPNTIYWIRVKYKGTNLGWSFWSIPIKATTTSEFTYSIINETGVVAPFNLTEYSSIFMINNTLYSFGNIASEIHKEYVRKYSLDLTTNLSILSVVTSDLIYDIKPISRAIVEGTICEMLFEPTSLKTIILQRSPAYLPINSVVYDTVGFEPKFLLQKNRFVNIVGSDVGSISFGKMSEPTSGTNFGDIFDDVPNVFNFLSDFEILDVKLDNAGNFIFLTKESGVFFLASVSNSLSVNVVREIQGSPELVKFAILDNDYVAVLVQYVNSEDNFVEILSAGLASNVSAKRFLVGTDFLVWNDIQAVGNSFLLSGVEAFAVFNTSGIPTIQRKWVGVSSPVFSKVSSQQVVLESGKKVLALDRTKFGSLGIFPNKPYEVQEIEILYEGWTPSINLRPDLLNSFLQPSSLSVSLISSTDSVDLGSEVIEPIDDRDEF